MGGLKQASWEYIVTSHGSVPDEARHAVSQIIPKMGSTSPHDSSLVSIFSGPFLLPTLQHAFERIPEDGE